MSRIEIVIRKKLAIEKNNSIIFSLLLILSLVEPCSTIFIVLYYQIKSDLVLSSKVFVMTENLLYIYFLLYEIKQLKKKVKSESVLFNHFLLRKKV